MLQFYIELIEGQIMLLSVTRCHSFQVLQFDALLVIYNSNCNEFAVINLHVFVTRMAVIKECVHVNAARILFCVLDDNVTRKIC